VILALQAKQVQMWGGSHIQALPGRVITALPHPSPIIPECLLLVSVDPILL
jgi:hypothetical protein